MADATPEPAGEGENPFANLPMFAELARALSGQGPLNWDAARQFAHLSATGGDNESNVDPAVRVQLEALARIVEMHVRDVTGNDRPLPPITTVTRTEWARRTLDAYRPLFTELASSLARRPDDDADSPDDPMMAMLSNLSQMMAPSMMGMAVGSMVGRMAARSFGQYDLPIPRDATELLVLPANVDRFAAEWSLPGDEMRLWVLAQELTGATLFANASLREQLADLVRGHAGAFRPDSTAISEQFASIDSDDMGDPMAAMQRMLGDPALLLGAVESPEQRELAPHLGAAVAAVIGYVDYTVDSVAVRVIGGDSLPIAEAVRRRRVETGPDQVFIERLLGLRLTQEQVQRGKAFVAGVVDRVGERRLTDLLSADRPLPTPAEFDAPGLWVARLEL